MLEIALPILIYNFLLVNNNYLSKFIYFAHRTYLNITLVFPFVRLQPNMLFRITMGLSGNNIYKIYVLYALFIE